MTRGTCAERRVAQAFLPHFTPYRGLHEQNEGELLCKLKKENTKAGVMAANIGSASTDKVVDRVYLPREATWGTAIYVNIRFAAICLLIVQR